MEIEEKIKTAQERWAQGLISLGKAKKQKESRTEIERLANQMLDCLYDFQEEYASDILFKPTKASEHPIRLNRAETLSYFIGEGVCKEDKGFALEPWEKVNFKKYHFMKKRDHILVMGEYVFVDYNGMETVVDYTFGYKNDGTDLLKIFLHHSSLRFKSSNSDKIKAFDKKLETPEIVSFGDKNYHYARQISNSRFGHMPAGIAYCETAAHVQLCIKFCKNENVHFRIRSGGHQHEGMCSASDVLVIDLSRMYGAQIQYDKGEGIPSEATSAWIPVGMKLEVVYKELEAYGKTIPGGGCQSVNIGGLTQGGGWGSSIRKFGLTCDSIEEAELVLADGTILNTTEEKLNPKKRERILKALRGGGGGNFGVVTRFKFRLSPLGPHVTTFGIRWKNPSNIPVVIKKWILMQEKLNKLSTSEDEREREKANNLSCTTGLFLRAEGVTAGMGGKFYGSKKELRQLLETHLGELLEDSKLKPDSEQDPYFVAISQRDFPIKKSTQKTNSSFGLAANDQWVADFMNSNQLPEESGVSLGKQEPTSSSLFTSSQVSSENATQNTRDKYTVLPNAPQSTCDQPHPHKVTSAFPADRIDHEKWVDDIYAELKKETYHKDVNKYMIWHCFGGASASKIFQERSVFPYRNKPYLVQLQCWWDNSGKLTNDEGRAEEYVKWVNDFREKIMTKRTQGSFINFVDKKLVKDITTPAGRLELLKCYYGDSLDELRKTKTEFDPENLFEFEMSIPTE